MLLQDLENLFLEAAQGFHLIRGHNLLGAISKAVTGSLKLNPAEPKLIHQGKALHARFLPSRHLLH